MSCDLTSKALLLVQLEGSRKPSVPQTVSVATLGTTIIIKPTLALSSDQYSTFNHTTSAQGALAYSHQLYFQNRNEHRSILVSSALTGLNKNKL